MGMNRYRNYKALYEEDGWEWTIWPYSIAMLAATIAICAGAANSAPSKSTTPPAVPRTTKNCPIGTYTQSDYCVSLERAE